MDDERKNDERKNYKIITVHIGDNSVIIGRKIWDKYVANYSNDANNYYVLDENGYPRAVYVDNNANIKKIMTEIDQLVESITTLACFNIIGDLDSLMYYDVLSYIKRQYTNAILLNICIMPPTKIVLNPDVDNLILYNISAISNFTNSTILIDYDTLVKKGMGSTFKDKQLYTEDVENRIADILSYYIFVMFINENTRQESYEIATNISKSMGIATLAYEDDTLDSAEMAIKLTENYLVGFPKSTIIYRKAICDDSDVETKINEGLKNETLFVFSKIDTLCITALKRPDLPARGLTIVIDTGIKAFFSDIIDRLKIGKNDIIMDIYSSAGNIYNDLTALTKLQITVSSFVAHMCLINEYKMDDDTIDQMKAAAAAFDSPINTERAEAAAAEAAAAATNAIKQAFPDKALIGEEEDVSSSAAGLAAFSKVYSSYAVFKNKDIITAAVKKALAYTSSLKDAENKFIITLNVIYEIIKQNEFFILKYPRELKEIIGLAIEAGKKLPGNSLYLNMFEQLRQVEALNKVDLEILRLDRLDTYMAFLLKNAENKFSITLNIIYEFIKQNNLLITEHPEELKKIISLAIEAGKNLPYDSKYLELHKTLSNTLSDTQPFTEDTLKILRLDKIDDDESFIDKSSVDVMTYILDKVIINYKDNDTYALTAALNNNLTKMINDAQTKDRDLNTINDTTHSNLPAVVEANAELLSAENKFENAKNVLYSANGEMLKRGDELKDANNKYIIANDEYNKALSDSVTTFNRQQQNILNDNDNYDILYRSYVIKSAALNFERGKYRDLESDYINKNKYYEDMKVSYLTDIYDKLDISNNNSDKVKELYTSHMLPFAKLVVKLLNNYNKLKSDVSTYRNYLVANFNTVIKPPRSFGSISEGNIRGTLNTYFRNIESSAQDVLNISRKCVDSYKILADEYNKIAELYYTTTDTSTTTHYITTIDRDAWNSLNTYADDMWKAVHGMGVSADPSANRDPATQTYYHYTGNSYILKWAPNLPYIRSTPVLDIYDTECGEENKTNGSLILLRVLNNILTRIDNMTLLATAGPDDLVNLNQLNSIINREIAYANMKDYIITSSFTNTLNNGITNYNKYLDEKKITITTRLRSTVIPEGDAAERANTAFIDYNKTKDLSNAEANYDLASSQLNSFSSKFTGFNDYGTETKLGILKQAKSESDTKRENLIGYSDSILMPAQAAFNETNAAAAAAKIKYNELITDYELNKITYTVNYDALILSHFYLSLLDCSNILQNNTIRSKGSLFNQVKKFIKVADDKKYNTLALNESVAIYKLWLVFEIKSQLKSNVSLDDSIELIKNKISSEPNMNNNVYIEALDDIKNYFMLVNSTINKIEVLSGNKLV